MDNQTPQAWKPKTWITLTFGFFFWQFVFLYINRAKYFWIYFALCVIVGVMVWDLPDGEVIFSLFYIICPLHAVYLNRNYDSDRIRPWYSRWWGLIISIAIVILLVFITRSFVIEPFRIPAASMSPNLNIGDIILVNKIGYGSYGTYGLRMDSEKTRDLQAGRIYAFRHPKTEIAYVKRLIGMPGDDIEIRGEDVFVNGEILVTTQVSQDSESFLMEEVLDGMSYSVLRSKHRPRSINRVYSVPEDKYFFLGDNRDKSNDSRYWGFVPDKNIIGEVVYVFQHR